MILVPRLRTLSLLCVCSILAVSCAKKDPGDPANTTSGGTTKTPTPQVWRVGNGAEPKDLDPQVITGIAEHKIVTGLFEGLVAEDPKDLHPLPGLAESWEISPDGLAYTFHLRAGLRWSNGDPISADDFVQTYRRGLTPAFGSEYSYLLWFMVGAEAYNKGTLTDFSKVGVKAVDDRTLQITLHHRTPYLLKIIASHYTWSPLPVKVIAKFGPLEQRGGNWTRAGNLVSSGPFILKEWLPQQRIVLERNPLYWDAKTVKLDQIIFYPIEEPATEERMFRTKQLDMTYELPQTKLATYRKEYPASLRIEPYLGVYFYRFNVSRPPFNDKRVRQALSLAIDRESIVKNVTRGDQQPEYAISYPGTAGYTPRARLTGTVADAQRLLAEAGFPGGRNFPTAEVLYNTSDNNREVAEAIQAMWRKNLGIDVKLVNQEWKVYLDSQHTQNYQIQRSGWIADYVDPHVFLEIWTTGNGNNDTLWSNAEYDKLFEQAIAAKDDADRYEIYQKMDAILVDELPVMPIFYYTRVHAVSSRVKGYYPTLLDNHPYKYIYMED
ncbi:MAG: extracellular solute-binding protein family 5 [Verrucomicrobia bacterium]|nr:extracellular solute-binding protein family 5 [Verrucomicrobiota bacterium]